jgi:hypothetical protein
MQGGADAAPCSPRHAALRSDLLTQLTAHITQLQHLHDCKAQQMSDSMCS